MILPFLLSWILSFLQPQHWTWPDSAMGRTGSRQERAVPPSRHFQLWASTVRKSPRAREIQPWVSKNKEQPPMWQTLSTTLDIFGFHCFHFNLCLVFTIKLSSHFLHTFFNSTSVQLSSACIPSFLPSSPLAYSPIFFFPLYLSFCPPILFKQNSAPGMKASFHLLHGEGTKNHGSSRIFSHRPSACRIYPFLKSFLSHDCFVCNNFRKCDMSFIMTSFC